MIMMKIIVMMTLLSMFKNDAISPESVGNDDDYQGNDDVNNYVEK